MTETMPARQIRRLVKGVWWLVTPWRLPQRLRALRARTLIQAELDEIGQRPRARADALTRGETVTPPIDLDLCDDAAVAAWVGRPVSDIFWQPVNPAHIVDQASAARYCMDLWRRHAELRQRFPLAFSQQRDAYAEFLCGGDALTQQASEWIRAALRGEFADRARQYFLATSPLRAVAPDALLPSGRALGLRWFLRHEARHSGLALEEIWWLFLQASQDPRRELTTAYRFTLAWQRQHPAALTAFGWTAFASWFAAQYGAAPADSADWLYADMALSDDSADAQIRAAYWAYSSWRERHPQGLATADGARALLDWLASQQGPLTHALREQVGALDQDALAQRLAQPGVNVIGHFCYPSGLSASVKSLARGLDAAGVPTTLRDVRTDVTDQPHHADFGGIECHDITLIHVQPQPLFDRVYELADLAPRQPRTYRIAYWYWEFDQIPAAWLEQAQCVDEVWAATEFVARGLREQLPVPVYTLPPGVELAPFEPRAKPYFGLADGRYTFLFVFHMMSVMERKNPLGLIRAFKQAFHADEPVQLVIKTSAGERDPASLQQLLAAAADANIKVIDALYSPGDMLALIDCCDAYASLHRGEGLGLTMAEAMLLGKPVIATGYSGNLDFMNSDNSLLVPFDMTTIDKMFPNYNIGMQWVEPSVEHAARFMRQLYEAPAWGRELGAKARASARRNTSMEAAGVRMRQRIREICVSALAKPLF